MGSVSQAVYMEITKLWKFARQSYNFLAVLIHQCSPLSLQRKRRKKKETKKETFRAELVTLAQCRTRNNDKKIVVKEKKVVTDRGSVRSTRSLGPTMTARGQSIGISIGMLPQILIISRLDQLSRLDARI